MKEILIHLWDRRTTVLGYMQVMLGVLVAADGIFTAGQLKWLILINALLTAGLGHYNNGKLKRAGEPL